MLTLDRHGDTPLDMRVRLSVLYQLRWMVKMRTSLLLALERIPWFASYFECYS